MKTNNKKGIGLMMAIMIITVLLVMAAGFFQITDYSSKSVTGNVQKLKLYWAAESAKNYNVNWWVNQPDSVRKDWPNVYFVPATTKSSAKGATPIPDDSNIKVSALNFKNAAGTAVNDELWLHPSSLYEGNTASVNNELENYDGTKLITVRYKGSRKGFPEQAVWVLDSYAYDNSTNEIANIVLSNVYNYKSEAELDPFHNAELISATMAGTGFHGVKGRFNEQDTRFGQCYFGDMVHFDYITGASKNGPLFWGLVKSAAWKRESYDPSYNAKSWYKQESNRFTTVTGAYYYGLGINSAKATTETKAINDYALTSLKGGYEKQAKPLNTDNVVWTWADVEKFGAKEGLYFLEDGIFNAGVAVNVKLKTTLVSAQPRTTAEIYVGTTLKKTLSIGKGSNQFKGIAVRDKFGEVSISGVSNDDFSLITETDKVNLVDHFYLYGAADILAMIQGWVSTVQYAPPKANLEMIWSKMLDSDVVGHLAVIQGLAITDPSKMTPIYIPNEKLLFSTASYITQLGELTAKGTGNTALRFYNVGAVMVLDAQTKMTGPSDTAQKWPKIYVQDQRYLREDEELPPFCGESPGAHVTEAKNGLNPNHRWANTNFGKTKDWKDVVWRYGTPQ